MLEIRCWLSERRNTLMLANGNLNTVVVPNDRIDEFIGALKKHAASTGDGCSFTLDFETGEVKVK